ncbi:MAG: DUF4238 domain-containing protein [Methanosarcinaceae archaeon]|nr:DUF4238 domain-containing protein [Methanosarcinaceae archaeon]
MGDHFLPQFYLKGFAELGDSRLWMYEKEKKPEFLPIKNIANEKKLYGKVESWLSKEIEGPANKVLTKVRNKETISTAEKSIFSAYVYVMYKRVPSGYKRFCAQSPFISQIVIDALKAALGPDHPNYQRKLEEARSICDKLEKNPPKAVWQQAVQMKNEDSISLFSDMTWTFMTCDEPDFFIVGDNPVFFHGTLGIHKPQSDVTFPISSQVCLLATWWNKKDLVYAEATPWLIREINRRAAHNAARFIYSGENRPWISTILNKKRHEIHMIALHRLRY